MPAQKLTAEILAAAIEGFEAQRRRIDEQIADLRQMLHGGRTEPATMPAVPKRKRKMSAAGRKAISESTKKRWAMFHAAKKSEKVARAKEPAPKNAKKRAVKSAPAKLAKKSPVKKVQKKAASAPAVAPPVAAQ